MNSPKYNRTPHLPWSPGGSSDDRRLETTAKFLAWDLVLTEKMDGSNVCLEAEGCFARSHTSAPNHPSFDAFKAFHATVKSRICPRVQVFGEWLYAKHSIHYTALPSYFLIFGVRDMTTMMWASWEEVELWADELGVPTVPVLWRGRADTTEALRSVTDQFAHFSDGKLGGAREGVVIRRESEFHDALFSSVVAKWVRANHVQTDERWKNQEIVRNLLAAG